MPVDIRDVPMVLITADVVRRFWECVHRVDEPYVCWNWLGDLNKGSRSGGGGYGVLTISPGPGKRSFKVKAHRLSLAIQDGTWPVLHVLHGCDNPACVRPDHLREGTPKQNVRDAINRGRHHTGKLTEEDVEEIRGAYLNETTREELAEWYGISMSTVYKLVQGLHPDYCWTSTYVQRRKPRGQLKPKLR